MTKVNCPECWWKIVEDTKFCSHCGVKLEWKVSEEVDVPEEDHYKCSECGKKIKEDSKKCLHCWVILSRKPDPEEHHYWHEKQNNKSITWDDLEEKQKHTIKQACLGMRLLAIILPWISLLWARAYGLFFIFGWVVLLASFAWEVTWFVSIIIRIIVIILLPELAFNRSKGNLRKLI